MRLRADRLLYVWSLLCAVGIATSIHDILGLEPTPPRDIARHVRVLMATGHRALPDVASQEYDWDNRFWWQFHTANFTGAVPRPKSPGPKNPGPPTPEDIDLKKEILVLWISYGGDYTRVVVQYRRAEPELDVHPVGPGDHLRGRLQGFVLVDVAPDAGSVIFEDRSRVDASGGHPQHLVRKQELPLIGVVFTGPWDVLSPHSEPPLDSEPASPSPPARTRVQPDGRVVVGTDDFHHLHRQGQRFVREDIHLRDYASGGGGSRARGVAVQRLAGRVRGLGVHQGDVLISVNGIPVRSRAELLAVGKRLYRRQGVRRFRLRLLRRGREVERTFILPREKE